MIGVCLCFFIALVFAFLIVVLVQYMIENEMYEYICHIIVFVIGLFLFSFLIPSTIAIKDHKTFYSRPLIVYSSDSCRIQSIVIYNDYLDYSDARGFGSTNLTSSHFIDCEMAKIVCDHASNIVAKVVVSRNVFGDYVEKNRGLQYMSNNEMRMVEFLNSTNIHSYVEKVLTTP